MNYDDYKIDRIEAKKYALQQELKPYLDAKLKLYSLARGFKITLKKGESVCSEYIFTSEEQELLSQIDDCIEHITKKYFKELNGF